MIHLYKKFVHTLSPYDDALSLWIEMLPLHNSRILYVHTSDEASLKYIEERVLNLTQTPKARLQLLRSRWLHSLWIQGRSLLVKEPRLLGL